MTVLNPVGSRRVAYQDIAKFGWFRGARYSMELQSGERVRLFMFGKPRVQAAFDLRSLDDEVMAEMNRLVDARR